MARHIFLPLPTWPAALLVAVCAWLAFAGPVRAADEFLDPEVAFKLAARAGDDRSVELRFDVAPGYYLYREQFRFTGVGATLGAVELPPGKTKFDETFQKNVETYRGQLRIVLPVASASGPFRVLVVNQGCADRGLCYPPMQRTVEVSLTGFGGAGTARVLPGSEPPAAAEATGVEQAAPSAAPSLSGDVRLDAALQGGGFWTVIGVFFGAGVLLSLTPCVLPMLPILSSIIVGQGGAASRSRGVALAASYSLGMAVVYTALGIAAGLAGEGLAAALQQSWVLMLFAGALIVLALSMFGVYELRLPAAFTGRMTQMSQRLPAGRIASVFAMGGVSALIVSPCVAAPLAGALVYLSQTRDVPLAGTALFSLAAGMSVPLLLIGGSAGALLPRAGAWMDEVKRFFGLLLLGVALWTVQSILPAALALALWGVLAIAAAMLLAKPDRADGRDRLGISPSVWRRALAAVLAAVGLIQLVGAASGGTNPLQPLAHFGARGQAVAVEFRTVRSSAELDAMLRDATRPVMLDFYADWCVSCKEMERYTFVDPAVRSKLAGAILLKADVTANNADDRELLKRFSLFGPPGTIFFDRQGREVPGTRLIGYQNAERFLETLQRAGI